MFHKNNTAACFLSIAASVSCCVLQVFAEVDDIGDAISYVYSLIVKLFIPIAVVSLAFAAYTLFGGNEQAVDKIPSKVKYIAGSLLGILLLGMLVNWGAGLGKRSGSQSIAWDPEGNNTIVSEAVPGANVYGMIDINTGDDTDSSEEEETHGAGRR